MSKLMPAPLPDVMPTSGPPVGWTVLLRQTVASGMPYVDLVGLGSYSDLQVIARDVTLATSGRRNFRFSTNNGSSFYEAVTDYAIANSDGTATVGSSILGHASTSASARTCILTIIGNVTDSPLRLCRSNSPSDAWVFRGSSSQINAIRFMPDVGTNTFLAGDITVLGRA